MGERRGANRVLVGKPEGKRPLGDPGVDGRAIFKWIFRNWDGGGSMYWIDLAQDSNRWLTLENKALYLQVPQKGDWLKKSSFSRTLLHGVSG
jgi:hypothetical protein